MRFHGSATTLNSSFDFLAIINRLQKDCSETVKLKGVPNSFPSNRASFVKCVGLTPFPRTQVYCQAWYNLDSSPETKAHNHSLGHRVLTRKEEFLLDIRRIVDYDFKIVLYL